MNAQHDADRLLHAFLQEGPAEMAPPLAARIQGEVHETKQRAGFRPGRNLPMSPTFRIIAPLAAVVVVGALLIANLGGPVPTQSPSAPPVASPVASPTLAASPSLGPTAYPLGAGAPWILIGAADHVTLVRADGTESHQILGGIGLGLADPAWSPDGNRIVFEGNGSAGSQLWLVDADGTNRRQLTPTPEGCPSATCLEAVNPAWSPDGTKIAYTAPEHRAGVFSHSALMVIDVATGTTTEIYSTDTTALARPTWSPDGKTIALEVDRFVGAPESSAMKDTAIGIIDLAAADHAPRMITDPAVLAGYPFWHPTLDLIVFRTNRLDNGTELMLDPAMPSNVYTIRSDGSALTKVTSYEVGGAIVRAPSWTPDGRILFTSRSRTTGDETLRVIDADGTNEASATGSIITQGQGRWRPGT